jgi:hypothetical protein
MKLPSWPTLFAVAGGCGFGLAGMMFLTNKQRDSIANEAAFVKRAVDIMKSQQTVKELLGEDIKVGRITLNDGWGSIQRSQARLRVPIKGEHDNAYLYVYARKKEEKGILELYKLEATFGKIAGKKLIIMDRTNEDDSAVGDTKQIESEEDKSRAASGNEPNAKPQQRKMTKEQIKEAMKSW